MAEGVNSGTGGGGDGGGGDDGGDGGGGGWTNPLLPDWVKKLRPLANTGPEAFIRAVIFRPIVRAVLGLGATVISAFMILFRGEKPGFYWDEEVWGLADFPVLIGEWIFNVVIWFVSTAFTTLMDINRQLVPTIPGPLDGLLLWIFLALELTLLSHLLVRGLRAVADSVPIAASIETFIFG